MIPESFIQIIKNIWVYQAEKPLFYTGLSFWVALTAILAVYSILYRKNLIRNIYLLLVSWFIYYQMNGTFLALLAFSCFSNYGFGLLIGKYRIKVWMILAVGFNLFILSYFKYAYFFTESYNRLFESDVVVINWLARFFNLFVEDALDTQSILLPIGISFYTFQAISYVVDVYKQRVDHVRNVLDFSFYLSFFPQLVAGPIVRAASFIPQLYQKYQLSKEEFSHSIYLIGKGLFKKMVIADYLAINFIDRVFDAPQAYSGLENLMSVYAYSIQIYCDFSGYTDIAIGLALIFGFKIPVNFNAPYQATSLTDFWHRWHISLSLWLKDYLYIPLGGNRKGSVRTQVNLLITMLLGGLWHGANLRFLIWGAVHGLGLVVEKAVRKLMGAKNHLKRWQEFLSIFVTFQVVSIAWVFFRADDFQVIAKMMSQLKYHFIPNKLNTFVEGYLPVLAVFTLGLVLIWFPYKQKEKIRGLFISAPYLLQGLLIVCILLIIAFVSRSGLQPFIYFRF